MLLNEKEVLSWLPHREPFLFVDRIESIQMNSEDLVGCKVLGHYITRAEHPIFAGHFPFKPVLPGVVQIEIMAQVGSFALFKRYSQKKAGKLEVALARVDEAKFRKEILPGMDLVIKTMCQRARGSFITNQCEIYWEDQLMSQAICMAKVGFKSIEEKEEN